MSLNDLWSIKEKGRWWVVGSAVVVSKNSSLLDTGASSSELPKNESQKPGDNPPPIINDKLLKMAKRLGMNTETRRQIFCIMLSSEVGF